MTTGGMARMKCKLYIGKNMGYSPSLKDGFEMYLAILGAPARELLKTREEKNLPSIIVFLDSAPEEQRQPLMEKLQEMAKKKNFGCLPTMAAFTSRGLDDDYDCGDQIFVITSEYEGSLFKSVIELSQGMGCAIVLKIGVDMKPLLMDLAHGTALEMRTI